MSSISISSTVTPLNGVHDSSLYLVVESTDWLGFRVRDGVT